MQQVKLAVLINYKDRPTELCLLLQSLRTQTYQDFDIFILDDCSGSLLTNYHFFNCLVQLIMSEGHKVFLSRTEFPYGVSRARQKIVDNAKDDYEFLMRVDDDCILKEDYIDQLFMVIDEGYDLATGVTIPFSPIIKRETRFLKGICGRIILDNDGKRILDNDDCGMPYVDSVILPAHQFRSCALYKSAVHKSVNYTPTKLSMNGYREETLFSLKLLMTGFKLGFNSQAVNYHLACPSGGERSTMNLAPFNQGVLDDFIKENKHQLIEILNDGTTYDPLELNKETNLARK